MPIQLFNNVGPLGNNVYVIYDQETKDALLVDPALQSEPVWEFLEEQKLRLTHIVNTHGHMDHVANNAYFKRQAPHAELMYHQEDQALVENAVQSSQRWGMKVEASPTADAFLTDGTVITVGSVQLQVVHTPGHTPGGCSLVTSGAVITGDTLFQNSVGRCDLPGGSMPQLLTSIRARLLPLPEETLVCPGHGATSDIGTEKENNPFLHEASLRQMGLL